MSVELHSSHLREAMQYDAVFTARKGKVVALLWLPMAQEGNGYIEA